MTWRSLLYVPANVPRFVQKAQSRGADALILDLEDSIPDDHKSQARDALRANWGELCNGRSDLLVRINGDMRRAVHDLEAAVQQGLSAIYLPKVSSPDYIRHIAQALDTLEAERELNPASVKIIAMIETPTALENAFQIAAAHPRVTGLTLGSEDLATECGMQPSAENLFGARQKIVFAARAAGIAPYGLLDSVANLFGENLSDLVSRSREFGFVGATVVHPDSLAPLNSGFEQSAQNRDWATRVLAALDAAAQTGAGTARLGSKMIDKPMRLRALQILNLPQK